MPSEDESRPKSFVNPPEDVETGLQLMKYIQLLDKLEDYDTLTEIQKNATLLHILLVPSATPIA